MTFNANDFAAALTQIDSLAGTTTGKLADDLRAIAAIGKDVGAELLAGTITPAQAAANFDDLTRAARTRIAREARLVATAASGMEWLKTAAGVLGAAAGIPPAVTAAAFAVAHV